MQCPVCRDTQLVMSERQGIEIDYCPSCRGIWLDRGELDKIIERSGAAQATAQVPQQPPAQMQMPSQPMGYGTPWQGQHPPKRKKSFLEELFD